MLIWRGLWRGLLVGCLMMLVRVFGRDAVNSLSSLRTKLLSREEF